MNDLYSNIRFVKAASGVDFDTDFEGDLIEVLSCRGIAMAFLMVLEDASQATTEKLDVTIHCVADNDEAPVTANKIAAFTQIVGSNTAANHKQEIIAVNLDLVDDRYIQFLFTETNTYEGMVFAGILMPGGSQLPIQ